MTNVGEPHPRMSDMPIVTILQAIVTKYLKKGIIVDVMDLYCVRDVVLQ